MKQQFIAFLFALGFCAPTAIAAAEQARAQTTIEAQPFCSGKIDPKLFGNFIELLDDVVPAR